MIESRYLQTLFDISLYGKTLAKTLEFIKKFQEKQDFDAIAFSGMSGAALAFPLSLELKKSLICIRKYKATYHNTFEGNIDARSYIIIDDHINTGNTILKIIEVVKEKVPESRLVGIYLYDPVSSHLNHKTISDKINCTIISAKLY